MKTQTKYFGKENTRELSREFGEDPKYLTTNEKFYLRNFNIVWSQTQNCQGCTPFVSSLLQVRVTNYDQRPE